MERKGHKYLSFIAAVLCVAGLSAVSCSIEESFSGQDSHDGLPAEIELRLSVPDMSVGTRALTEQQELTVNNIWIGIYDAESGRLKNRYYYTVSHEDRHNPHFLPPTDGGYLKTSSGESYIVAVANAGDSNGISSDPSVGPQDGTLTNLRELLDKADTFDKYKSVAAALPSPSIVEYTEANIVMSGSYTSSSEGFHPGKPGVEPVYIKKGYSSLSGRIHLRRVISKVNFSIKAAPGITVRPASWRVVNNPRMCFIYEREDNDADGFTNAGDVVTGHLTDASPNANYGASVPETEIAGTSAGGYSFSFYTYENKRTGIIPVPVEDGMDPYYAREKEYKTGEGENSGIYVSLCGDGSAPDILNDVNRNNFATYVEIACNVSYTTDDNIHRTGTAIYTVHLGYMDNDANDFNVRRNYRYNYSMTIFGLNQIVLEASGAEKYPGLEGDVIDATEEIVTVDAHYGIYNISLSNRERARLHYSIKAPYDDDVKEIEGGFISVDGQGEVVTTSENNEYYNWVRIKPTSGADVFAEYKTGTADDPWYLDDLLDVQNHPGYNGNTDPENGQQQYYTVFINEHVYDRDGEDPHPLNDWVRFVNKSVPRSVLLLVQDVDVSSDSESRYSKGKYLIRQHSIQTYYSTDLANFTGAATALGVEHINESYGKRIDWRWAAPSVDGNGTTQTGNSDLSNSNGRWNLWKFLNNATDEKNNPGSGGEASRSWFNSIKANQMATASYGMIRYVNARGEVQTVRSGFMQKDEEGYAVPALAYYTSASDTRSNDPQNVARYYEAVALCMSRNRDLDGDGQISPDEVRWYLPAEGKYERIMLGRNSLQTPLFSISNGNYYTNSNDEIAEKHNNYGYDGTIGATGSDNQIQFISSDHMKFFPEEGGSYHRNISIYWPNGGTSYGRYPWNIRCVRNLGVDLSSVTVNPADDPVEKAYHYDAASRVFDMTHYYGNSLRGPVNTYIEVHSVLDLDKNKTPKKMKVSSSEASYRLGDNFDGARNNTVKDALDANTPCAGYSETGDGGATWRAPNQRELLMMINEGLLSSTTFSCTMEGYGERTRFSCSSSGKIMFMNKPQTSGSFSVRCVRDLK